MTNDKNMQDVLRELFAAQGLAVLATQRGGRPYANLVAFSAAADLRRIGFITPRQTRKYEYLTANPRAALLIHNSANQVSDFQEAAAVTALGKALEIDGRRKAAFLERYLAKHPHLAEFAESPSSAVFEIDVETYVMVRNFQDVKTLHLSNGPPPEEEER